MSMSRCTVTLLAALITLPTVALAADAIGLGGSIIELDVNHSTADAYLQFHGRVVISDGTRSAEYRWGGTSCSNRILPESLVTMLQRAMESGATVVPRHVMGQGTNRCLVGFTLTP